jgi:succinate dehydrogenase/fumarate reductase flavoprotein subunit
MAAGGNIINMDEAFTALMVYPPAKLTYGILVNRQGQRFINEDCYLARLSYFGSLQEGYEVYLLIQNEDYESSSYLERLRIVAVGDTIEEIEQEAGFVSGTLQNTVSLYNQYAEQDKDPVFHKSPDWVKPLSKPPFALVSYNYEEIIARTYGGDSTGPLTFSLGGLHTRPTGEVVTVDGTVIPGLYAAGRTVAGIPRLGKNYASGMSVGDATFFGRQAGKQAANGSC